jgi:uncharacterized protein (UPF0333 family)
MKKKKVLVIIVVILVCIITSVCAVFFINNKNDEKVPLNHLINAINNRDASEIPKAFHEYCSFSIEQNISEEKFENYINGISEDFGGDFQISCKITHISSMSKEDIEMYEDNARNIYSNYPYLSNGGTIKFDNVYNITTEMTIKGKYQEEKGNVEFTVVEIDNKYYFLHIPNQMMSAFIDY